MGLGSVVGFVILWDLLAKTALKGRICTVSSDCWTWNRTPARKAAFWMGWAVLTVHLWRIPRARRTL